MHKLKLLIMAIATVLFISCGSLTVTTENQPYDWYYDNYNYLQIHMIYSNSPRWFYDNLYFDEYGRSTYYHHHPYYRRYLRERTRRIRNHNQIILPTVGHTRVNSSRNIKRTNHSTQTRRAVTNNTRTTSTNRTSTTNRTVRPTQRAVPTRTTTRTIRPSTPTRTIRSNNTSTIRRSNSQSVRRSVPTRTTSSKRRN